MIEIKKLISKEVKFFCGKEPNESSLNPLVIKTNNLSYEEKISYSNLALRNISKDSIKDNYLLPGDLLIEKSGGTKTHSVGYVNYFDGESDKFVANHFILTLCPNSSKVYPKFLFYNIRYLYESGLFNDCYNRTTGIQNLNKERYLPKQINLPKYEKQINISKNLDNLNLCISIKHKEHSLLNGSIKSLFNSQGDIA